MLKWFNYGSTPSFGGVGVDYSGFLCSVVYIIDCPNDHCVACPSNYLGAHHH